MEDQDHSRNDEISLLDIAVIIAESWKLLIIIPLLAGAVAYFAVKFMSPQIFTSEALIQAEPNQITLLQSARVLDDAIRESSLLEQNDNQLSATRARLIEAMDVKKINDTDIYQIRLSLSDPQEAKHLLTRIIDQLIQESAPAGHYRKKLELRLEAAQTALGDLNKIFAKLNESIIGSGENSPIIQGEIGQSLVVLISSIEAKQRDIAQTTRQLNGSLSQGDVVQAPTLPDKPQPGRVLMSTILVVMLTGFLLLIGVFIRSGLAQASQSKEGSAKIARIRRAFWLSAKPDGS